jgi:hypothetical protein
MAVAAARGSNSSTLSIGTYSLVRNPLHIIDWLDVAVAELLCDANADLNHLNSEGDSAMVRVWLRRCKC